MLQPTPVWLPRVRGPEEESPSTWQVWGGGHKELMKGQGMGEIPEIQVLPWGLMVSGGGGGGSGGTEDSLRMPPLAASASSGSPRPAWALRWSWLQGP